MSTTPVTQEDTEAARDFFSQAPRYRSAAVLADHIARARARGRAEGIEEAARYLEVISIRAIRALSGEGK